MLLCEITKSSIKIVDSRKGLQQCVDGLKLLSTAGMLQFGVSQEGEGRSRKLGLLSASMIVITFLLHIHA